MQKMGSVKEYLQQIRRNEEQIRRLEETIATIHSEMSGLRSPRFDTDRVQTSGNDDRLLLLLARCESVEARLQEDRAERITTNGIIIQQIGQLPNHNHSEVLYLRYVKYLKWDDIAERMHFNRRWVERLHGAALQEFSRLHSDSISIAQ